MTTAHERMIEMLKDQLVMVLHVKPYFIYLYDISRMPLCLLHFVLLI